MNVTPGNYEINAFKGHSKTRPVLERNYIITVKSSLKLMLPNQYFWKVDRVSRLKLMCFLTFNYFYWFS